MSNGSFSKNLLSFFRQDAVKRNVVDVAGVPEKLHGKVLSENLFEACMNPPKTLRYL